MVVLLTRNSSFAQAPKSIFLQRGLQNGRETLDGANTLSPRQVGQRTTRLVALGRWTSGVVMSTMQLQSLHFLGRGGVAGLHLGASFELRP